MLASPARVQVGRPRHPRAILSPEFIQAVYTSGRTLKGLERETPPGGEHLSSLLLRGTVPASNGSVQRLYAVASAIGFKDKVFVGYLPQGRA